MTTLVYEWPLQPRIDPPQKIPGVLVTWSEYRGLGAEEGLLAWIGGVRIGRVGKGADVCEWWCALPCLDDEPIGGDGTLDECKRACEELAQRWVAASGLLD